VDVLTSLLLLKKNQSPISPQTDSVGEKQCVKIYRKELTYLQSKPREHSQRRGQYTDSKNQASRFGSFKHTTMKKNQRNTYLKQKERINVEEKKTKTLKVFKKDQFVLSSCQLR